MAAGRDERAAGVLAVLLAACASAPSRDGAAPSAAPSAAEPSDAPVAAASTPETAVTPVPPPRLPSFEPVLDKGRAGIDAPDAVSIVWHALPDGLLVVAQMPPKAFVVRGREVAPQPKFFDGLRSPAPDWPAEEFMVSGFRGTLDELSFDLYAPATEYADEARGKPGKFRTRSGRRSGAKATQPRWVGPDIIATPFTTKKGARLYEVASGGEDATASAGFSFRIDGPAHGETLPIPSPGKNGCRYAMLGHALLTQTADGAILGLGTLCTSGDQPLSTAKLEGVAPPLQSNSPRLGEGALAVERFVDGKGTVMPLPGADRVAEFAYFDFVRVPAGTSERLYVVSQIAGARGSQAYVAELDGDAFHDVTPEGAPELLMPFVSKAGELYLLHQRVAFVRRGATWEPIALERSETCGADWMSTAIEAPRGDLFLNGGVGCLWVLPRGAKTAARIPLPELRFVQSMVASGDDLYVVFSGRDGDELTRVRW